MENNVRLYERDDEHNWIDKGMGKLTVEIRKDMPTIFISVNSNVDGTPLLQFDFRCSTFIQKQQFVAFKLTCKKESVFELVSFLFSWPLGLRYPFRESVIIWGDREYKEYALSFIERSYCDDLWNNVCALNGINSLELDVRYAMSDEVQPQRNICSRLLNEQHQLPQHSASILPSVEIANLPEIASRFCFENPRTHEYKTNLVTCIENEDTFIPKLLECFRICEDLEDLDSLHSLFEIVKGMFYLNSVQILSILFLDENIFDVIGCLEYDPSKPVTTKHREYLKNVATFKEVIPIQNSELLSKIHQTYRVQYIQDIILPVPLIYEENQLAALASFLFYNKTDVCLKIQEDKEILKTLFQKMHDDDISESFKRDLLWFLKESCVFSMTLQQKNREEFYQALYNYGIFSTLQMVLKRAALDIFSFLIDNSSNLVREHILFESAHVVEDDELIFNLVISEILNDPDPEFSNALQIAAFIKVLVDPNNMTTDIANIKNEFLQFFYRRSISLLFAPLLANTVDSNSFKDDYHVAQLQYIIIDLCTFFFAHHGNHIKKYFVDKELLSRILYLLKSKHQFLKLGIIRLMKRIVSTKDETFFRHIIKCNHFEPIVEAFFANGKRSNLFNSSVLALFHLLVTDELDTLTVYFTEAFISRFEDINYTPIFKQLKEKCEKVKYRNSDGSLLSPSTGIHGNYVLENRTLDFDEERYFDEEDPCSDMITNESSNIYSSDKPFKAFTCAPVNDDRDEDIFSRVPLTRSYPTINFNINLPNANFKASNSNNEKENAIDNSNCELKHPNNVLRTGFANYITERTISQKKVSNALRCLVDYSVDSDDDDDGEDYDFENKNDLDRPTKRPKEDTEL